MTLGTQAVKVIARASHDYNGDGIVGAGDIAMRLQINEKQLPRKQSFAPTSTWWS